MSLFDGVFDGLGPSCHPVLFQVSFSDSTNESINCYLTPGSSGELPVADRDILFDLFCLVPDLSAGVPGTCKLFQLGSGLASRQLELFTQLLLDLSLSVGLATDHGSFVQGLSQFEG